MENHGLTLLFSLPLIYRQAPRVLCEAPGKKIQPTWPEGGRNRPVFRGRVASPWAVVVGGARSSFAWGQGQGKARSLTAEAGVGADFKPETVWVMSCVSWDPGCQLWTRRCQAQCFPARRLYVGSPRPQQQPAAADMLGGGSASCRVFGPLQGVVSVATSARSPHFIAFFPHACSMDARFFFFTCSSC